MMTTLPRLVLVAMVGSTMLAACSNRPAARPTPPAASSAVTHSQPAATTGHPAASRATPHAHSSASDQALPGHTGIAACDEYLSSYIACHRAAGIFPPGQLQDRYKAMRSSLLRDSKNPDIRPQLGARCNALASQLREVLHGKSCEVNPAPASSSP